MSFLRLPTTEEKKLPPLPLPPPPPHSPPTSSTGKGQVIDVAMTEGANYVALPLFKWLQQGVLPRKEGRNQHLDATNSFLHQGPPWSTTYTCSDGEWMTVQCIEPQFYVAFLKGMGLEHAQGLPHQHDKSSWPWMEARFGAIFQTKTRDEWADIFEGTDACTWPVLTASEAAQHPHNIARGSFAPSPGRPGEFEPVSQRKESTDRHTLERRTGNVLGFF